MILEVAAPLVACSKTSSLVANSLTEDLSLTVMSNPSPTTIKAGPEQEEEAWVGVKVASKISQPLMCNSQATLTTSNNTTRMIFSSNRSTTIVRAIFLRTTLRRNLKLQMSCAKLANNKAIKSKPVECPTMVGSSVVIVLMASAMRMLLAIVAQVGPRAAPSTRTRWKINDREVVLGAVAALETSEKK